MDCDSKPGSEVHKMLLWDSAPVIDVYIAVKSRRLLQHGMRWFLLEINTSPRQKESSSVAFSADAETSLGCTRWSPKPEVFDLRRTPHVR